MSKETKEVELQSELEKEKVVEIKEIVNKDAEMPKEQRRRSHATISSTPSLPISSPATKAKHMSKLTSTVEEVEETMDDMELLKTSAEKGKQEIIILQSSPDSLPLNMKYELNKETELKSDVNLITSLLNIPDIDYEVTKINQMGRRQARTLRLTSTALLNMRGSGKGDKIVSKYKPLTEIDVVFLEDIKTLRIKYVNEHDVLYESHIANTIVKDIKARIKMFYKVDRKRLIDFELALKFQMRTSQAIMLAQDEGIRESRSERASSSSSMNEMENAEVAKMFSYLHDYLYNFLYDLKSPEGRTIKHFINKQVPLMNKDPASAADLVRQFCDSMHQYIMEARLNEIEKLIKDMKIADIYLHEKEVSDLGLESTIFDDVDEITKQKERGMISDIIMANLESVVLPRIFGNIESCIKLGIDTVNENLLVKKMALLKLKSQSYFDIPLEGQSASNWRQPILELTGIEVARTPSEKLACLLTSAKSIYASHNLERNMLHPDSPKQYIMGADDFLPVHIFVVCNSDIKRPLLLTSTLWKLLSHNVLQGEGGYYLTVFESALAYIADMSLDKIANAGDGKGLVSDNKRGTWDVEKKMRTLSRIL